MHAIIKVRVMITRSITNCGRSSLKINRTIHTLMAAKKKAAKKKSAKKATKKVAKKKASKKKR